MGLHHQPRTTWGLPGLCLSAGRRCQVSEGPGSGEEDLDVAAQPLWAARRRQGQPGDAGQHEVAVVITLV